MNNIIVIFAIVLIIIWAALRWSSRTSNVLGAYIDLSTGSSHNFTPGVVTIDGVMHHYTRLARNYNFSRTPATYKNSPLIPAQEYDALQVAKKVKSCNGRFNIASNAFLFLDVDPTTHAVNGFANFETGDECVLEGRIVLKSPELVRIIGMIDLEYPTEKNVEYDILPGTAQFQLDFYDEEIILAMNHDGVISSYNCSR